MAQSTKVTYNSIILILPCDMNMNISCRITNANTQCGRITNPPERKIDLSFVDVSKLKMGKEEPVQTFLKTTQGNVYGGLTVTRIGSNQVTINDDTYNFEMHSWLKEPVRNVGTLLGRAYNGSGTEFKIKFRGVNTIHYNPYSKIPPYPYYASPYYRPVP